MGLFLIYHRALFMYYGDLLIFYGPLFSPTVPYQNMLITPMTAIPLFIHYWALFSIYTALFSMYTALFHVKRTLHPGHKIIGLKTVLAAKNMFNQKTVSRHRFT